MKPRIIIDNNIPFLQGRLDEVADCVYVDQFGFTPELVADADALLIRTRTQCNEALLGRSKVRLIATATIGMDQIDLPWCASRDITVRNSPGCNAPGVAQYVWASLLRQGFDPRCHTLGVVGHGNVGTIVADWGRRLGARVLLNDPPKAEKECPRVGQVGQLGDCFAEETYLPLEKVLAQSDAVTLHTPLTRTGAHPTYHLIGAPQLALMKPGAWLVNAARGPVCDTPALKHAIAERGIHAIIDTWEGEPDLDRQLLDMADVATFHIAGYSSEGKQRATRMVLEAVHDVLGLPVDTSGLAGPYSEPADLTAERIVASYDPAADMAPLRANPAAFDSLRANYNYRKEVN